MIRPRQVVASKLKLELCLRPCALQRMPFQMTDTTKMTLCFTICQTTKRCRYATDPRNTQASNHHPAPPDIHRQYPEPSTAVLLELDLRTATQRMT